MDRISNLSDEILCHILSFVPTKYSVRTSVVSPRWKHLYKFVPNLDFSDFIDVQDIPARNSSSFVDFVNSVLMLYQVSCMKKFHLAMFGSLQPLERFPIFSWLSSVLHRNVQVIDVNVNLTEPRTLPLDLFSCKTLTYLRLWGDFNVKLPHSVCLPCLTTCILGRVLLDDNSCRTLFSNCPVLVHLALIICDFEGGGNVLNISVPTLENLDIEEFGEENYQLVLNVPNLVSFKYTGLAAIDIVGLESLKSVIDAWICCDLETTDSDVPVVKLVQALCHVRELGLSFGPMEAFLRSGHQLPTFRNLTTLHVGPVSSFQSNFLPNLLDNSPRLEYLTFNHGYGGENDGADGNVSLLPEHVPVCVSQHLKEVDFMNFSGLDDDLKLMKYFLKYARNLEKMKIQSKSTLDEQFEISSKFCRIIFYSDDEEI